MRLAKSILLSSPRLCIFLLSLSFSLTTSAQDNSPYSRYGLGDMMPGSSIATRGMGGISAGYADVISINYGNPASYSQFQTFVEQRSKRLSAGRVILDVGMNLSNRTLVQPNTTNRFTSSDVLFSYLQLGMPLRKNWGLSFGLRPVSRISYLVNRFERLNDPVSGNPIDSAITQFHGTGGSYLPSIGTGFAIKNLSAGVNAGYLFGTRQNTTLRSLINDSVTYQSSDHTVKSSFGSLFFNAGIQYKIDLNKSTLLRLGFSGNWEQKLKGSQDVLRQTFTKSSTGEELQIDSVYLQNDLKGEVVFPAMYKAGFVLQHTKADNSGWLVGMDYSEGHWNNYRFFGEKDSVKNNWQVSVGAQIFPRAKANYFSRVVYRFGFFTGPDYINVREKLPQFGGSFGMALPIGNYSRISQTQFSIINLSFEYAKRGNNNNLLKENLFRFSLGFNFTDLWFGKKKYE